MAKVVLGLATSHSPQLSVHVSQWSLLREKDETDPRLHYQALLRRAKPGIEEELKAEILAQRYEACQKGIVALGEALRAANPDIIAIFGDDQHEQFHDDNMPTFAIYQGKSLHVVSHSGRNSAAWKLAEEQGWAKTDREYQAAWELAEHLIRSLTLDEFDVTRCNRLREEVGIGHAFSFLYRRLWPGGRLPMVPVMVNTYYPPNQPTPKRCYALGQAIRRAIESWEAPQRVAIMASGGLSHFVIDEELDRMTLEALRNRDHKRLWLLPREKLCSGTSEILNWVALAGATEQMAMKFLDYVPAYRSPAGTGCGMAFAYWV